MSGLYLAEEVLAPSYVLNQISLEEVSEVTKDITEVRTVDRYLSWNELGLVAYLFNYWSLQFLTLC